MHELKRYFSLVLMISLAACATVDNPGEPVEPEMKVIFESTDEATETAPPEQGMEIPAQLEATEVDVAQQAQEPVTEEAPQEARVGITDDPAIESDPVSRLCEEVGEKLGSVSIEDCLDQNLVHSAYTTAKRSLAFKDYPPLPEREPLGRVLVIGGIHGDEFSSVSVIMKWMKILDQYHSGLFHWRFVPTANPDGLLNHKSQRQNQNGVDLNRNFPTADWEGRALSYWEEQTHRNPRRHPGARQASEPETQWLVKQIDEFAPDVIISLHAPYHLVDYDGPPSAPDMLGELYLRRLGVFPGSLGNYAGIDLQVPIVTVELKYAGIIPVQTEIDDMWRDLVRWLRRQLSR